MEKCKVFFIYYIDYNIFYGYILELYKIFTNLKTQPTNDIEKADYIVAINYIPNNISYIKNLNNSNDIINPKLLPEDMLKKLILFQYEPTSIINSHFKNWNDENFKNRVFKCYRRNVEIVIFPYWNAKQYCFDFFEYDSEKKNRISFVTTLYSILEGHKLRIKLINFLESINYDYDLYGAKTNYGNGRKIDFFSSYRGEIISKAQAISKDKYSIGIENISEDGWVSEKFWDIVINNSVPFYWGCPNLENYIPKESFIKINPDNREETLEIFKKSIIDKEYDKRIKYINITKDLLLNKYNFLYQIENVI